MRRSPDLGNSHYLSAQDERNMFTHQYTRQLSTTPPPFSYSTYPAETTYAPYSQTLYHAVQHTNTPEMPLYTPYLPPLAQGFSPSLPSLMYPSKAEYFPQEEISPFSMSYASMAGIDIPAHHTYQEPSIHVRQNRYSSSA